MSGHIDFQLFNVVTRRLEPIIRRCSRIDEVQAQADNLGEGDDAGNLGWVFGHWNAALHYVNEDGEVALIGDGGSLDPGKAD